MPRLAQISACAALAALVTGGAACGDEVCGPGDAPSAGLSASFAQTSITYGQLNSSANNDCSVAGHPTSLTVDGVQTAPTTSRPFHITFCLPRPDRLGAEPVSLADTDLVEVIDVNAEVDGCIVTLDRTVTPTGTVSFPGYCSAGLAPEGYALELAGQVGVVVSCPDGSGGTTEERHLADLAGVTAVEALNL